MEGYLVIHISGFKYRYDHLFHVYPEGSSVLAIPDRVIPGRRYPVGSTEWYEHGWAVGDNPRRRFCKWAGARPKYRFHEFDEAVFYIQRLRQRRKRLHESYSLVYCILDPDKKEHCLPVSSLDDIGSFEAELAREKAATEKAKLINQAAHLAEYPAINRLKEVFGLSKAYALSKFLKSYNLDNGVELKRSMPSGSFYRCCKQLRQLGLIK